MKKRAWLVAGAVLVLLGAGAWASSGWWTGGWRPFPTPPEVPLDGVEKRVAKTIEAARREVLDKPKSGAAWGKLGMVLAINSHSEPAIRCFTQAEQLDRHDPRWPYLHGMQVMDRDRAQGIALARRALAVAETDEQRAAIHHRLAIALVEESRLDETKTHLDALEKIEAVSERLHFGRGLLAVAQRDEQAAVKHLGKLTESLFFSKRACSLLLKLKNVDHKLALKCQERASQVSNDFTLPDVFLVEMNRYKENRDGLTAEFEALLNMEKLDEADARLQLIAEGGTDSEIMYLLALLWVKKGKPRDAEKALRTAIKQDPNNVKAHYLRGQILLQAGEKNLDDPAASGELFRLAIAAEDEALALQNDHGYAHHIRGQALMHLGKTDEALQAFRDAVACRPEFAEFHLSLGEALAEASQLPEALKHLENAARLASPDDDRPRKALEKWRPASSETK